MIDNHSVRFGLRSQSSEIDHSIGCCLAKPTVNGIHCPGIPPIPYISILCRVEIGCIHGIGCGPQRLHGPVRWTRQQDLALRIILPRPMMSSRKLRHPLPPPSAANRSQSGLWPLPNIMLHLFYGMREAKGKNEQPWGISWH